MILLCLLMLNRNSFEFICKIFTRMALAFIFYICFWWYWWEFSRKFFKIWRNFKLNLISLITEGLSVLRFWIRPDANSLAGFGSVGANYFAGMGTVRMQIILPDSDPFRIRICMINSESLSGRQLSFFLQKIHKKTQTS